MTLLDTPGVAPAVCANPAVLARTTLRGDDVVFMYAPTSRATYTDYGCTFLAWGGASQGETVRWLDSIGVHGTGSMWCLTAGAKEAHTNADIRDAVARDITGKPIVVWWLPDVTHEGTPCWFGCTNHPSYRAHVRQAVAEQMRGNAPGLHVDDHLGTAHSVAFLGGCFCPYCMAEFRTWLQKHGTPEMLQTAGVSDWEHFDYRTLVRQHAADNATYQKMRESIPLFTQFLDCQLQLAAENVRQLGELAAQIVKRPITLSANCCLPELPHTVVTPHLTHMVGEVKHHAEDGASNLLDAVHAYRMADAIGKPLASTAKGQDWALVLEQGAHNLPKIWIALGYCAGQRLMAPHRQWCFTLEKGTHWYDGPAEAFAPMYRFVRQHPALFSDTVTVGPLAPPRDVPRRLDTAEQRDALEKSLGGEGVKPLQSGNAWMFPRRSRDGGLVVHVLNLAYTAATDTIEPQDSVAITLPGDLVGPLGTDATIFSYDALPVRVPVRTVEGKLTFTLPQLRVWAVISMEPAA